MSCGRACFEHRLEAERGHSTSLPCRLAHLFHDRFIGSGWSKACPHKDTAWYRWGSSKYQLEAERNRFPLAAPTGAPAQTQANWFGTLARWDTETHLQSKRNRDTHMAVLSCHPGYSFLVLCINRLNKAASPFGEPCLKPLHWLCGTVMFVQGTLLLATSSPSVVVLLACCCARLWLQ